MRYFLFQYHSRGSQRRTERSDRKRIGLYGIGREREQGKQSVQSIAFRKDAGILGLQKHFEQSKDKMKTSPARSVLKNTVELAIHTTTNESEFRKQLTEQGINTVVRRNSEGRIYGITFIDHESRSVWNGSQLDRNLSANVFNDWWNNGNKPELKTQDNPVSKTNTMDNQPTKDFFEFIPQKHSPNFDLGLFSLLPDAQGVDYEEEQFAKRMKKRRNAGGCKYNGKFV